MSILIEEVVKRRELDQLRELYVSALAARPTVLPDKPGKDNDSQFLVARDQPNPKVLGGLTLSRNHEVIQRLAREQGMRAAMEWANDYPLLTHLAVKPELQEQGIGSALLNRAVRLSQYRNSKMIWGLAEVHDGRQSAAFYERNGFTIHHAETRAIEVGGITHSSSVAREGRFFTLDLATVSE